MSETKLRPSRMDNESLLREHETHFIRVGMDAYEWTPESDRRARYVRAEILRRMVEPRR